MLLLLLVVVGVVLVVGRSTLVLVTSTEPGRTTSLGIYGTIV